MPKKQADVLVRATNPIKSEDIAPSTVDPSPTNDDILTVPAKDVKEGQEPSPDQVPQDTTDVTDSADITDDGIPSTQDVKPEVMDTRPIDNVAWEAKRKVDELLPVVNEIKNMLQQRNQEQQPKYTKAQLLTYAASPDATVENRMWAYGEIERMDKEERRKELEQLVTQTTERNVSDTRRAQSAHWVAQAFPDTVIKDSSGNPAGWNTNHPVLLKANEYLSRSKSLRDDPEGFAAAVKMAAFDMGVQVNKQLQNKVDRTTGQLRKEQKKGLVSSGGSRPIENAEQLAKNRLAKLQDEYRRTGDSKIFSEIIKLKGLNPWM